MSKKLPKVFANRIDRDISNNENVYYSAYANNEQYYTDDKVEDKNVHQKINDIFNSEKYVYKADVNIKLKDGVKKAKIIGYNNGYLITINNELIAISDIEDINFS